MTTPNEDKTAGTALQDDPGTTDIKIAEVQTSAPAAQQTPGVDQNIKAVNATVEEQTQNTMATVQPQAKNELSPEKIDQWLQELKVRFDALPELHPDVEWVDVERSLRADLETMRICMAFDEKGHAMNVFGEKNGKYIIASAWTDLQKVAKDHTNIVYDEKAQKWLDERSYLSLGCKGNAVSIIAKIMGIKHDEAIEYLAGPELHEQLRSVVPPFSLGGVAWLKTIYYFRETGFAICGDCFGISKGRARDDGAGRSFRAALMVKKITSNESINTGATTQAAPGTTDFTGQADAQAIATAENNQNPQGVDVPASTQAQLDQAAEEGQVVSAVRLDVQEQAQRAFDPDADGREYVLRRQELYEIMRDRL